MAGGEAHVTRVTARQKPRPAKMTRCRRNNLVAEIWWIEVE
jgi:hypothetical protein